MIGLIEVIKHFYDTKELLDALHAAETELDLVKKDNGDLRLKNSERMKEILDLNKRLEQYYENICHLNTKYDKLEENADLLLVEMQLIEELEDKNE